MDLRGYLELLRRRWWLLTVAPLLAAAGGFAVSQQMTPVYEASAVVQVRPLPPQEPIPAGDFLSYERFLNTYAELGTSPAVLQYAVERLVNPIPVQELREKLRVRPIANTELVRIVVRDDNPDTAADLANAAAQAFVVNNPGLLTAPGRLAVSEPAATPSAPVSPKHAVNILLAATFGLVAAGLLCFALESLDVTVRSRAAVESASGLRVIAESGRALPPVWSAEPGRLERLKSLALGRAASSVRVARLRQRLDSPLPRTAREAVSRIASRLTRYQTDPREARLFQPYHHLRSAVRFSGDDVPPKALLVTSPGACQGASATAIYLALAMAATGQRVVLVEADLALAAGSARKGSRRFGLSDLLVHDIMDPSPALLPTPWDGIVVLPAGSPAENPTELLSSARMSRLLTVLRTHSDFVILAASPVLTGDASALAARSDAVILVASAGRTGSEELRSASRLLIRVDASVLGVFLDHSGKDASIRRLYDVPAVTPGEAAQAGPARRSTRSIAGVVHHVSQSHVDGATRFGSTDGSQGQTNETTSLTS